MIALLIGGGRRVRAVASSARRCSSGCCSAKRHRPADPRRRPVRAPARAEGGHADDGRHRDRRRARSSATSSRTSAPSSVKFARAGMHADGADRRPGGRRLRRRLPRRARRRATSGCASGARPSGSLIVAVGFALLALELRATCRRTSRSPGRSTSTSAPSAVVRAARSLVVYASAERGEPHRRARRPRRRLGGVRVRRVRDHRVLAVPPPGHLPRARRPASLDLAIVAAAMLGACAGFLWWNAAPAQVFMGDTGSLAIGGAMAGLALLDATPSCCCRSSAASTWSRRCR